ncbi:MAG: bifunctional adenosylcobinamide kinase/adenosylcobinamide-phosphate guanylyltransferase [Ruminococcus flavefaciens]|nr:bifunctional adenosylcobinamide kinase/adenosylcobinamide-phosphate guanylyltransferase [Ruminococcus flavefaciens]MCM1059943.1 bifunctional adenosylcobinamide kinase/adenosylcobinamide-phosphate guanylyltransferase [Eubacterium sp.]
MIFITGGAYQGKARYAAEKYDLDIRDIADGETIGIGNVSGCKCVKNFHILIKRLLDSGENPLESTQKLVIENPDIIIIMNDIGGGIIPLEKSERIWREQVGMIGCFFAGQAECVERIICGIGMRIK